jgi:hypothetical protein
VNGCVASSHDNVLLPFYDRLQSRAYGASSHDNVLLPRLISSFIPFNDLHRTL